ncbi:MAG: hypothetical protein V7K98_10705 [Nostoc sp.]
MAAVKHCVGADGTYISENLRLLARTQPESFLPEAIARKHL